MSLSGHRDAEQRCGDAEQRWRLAEERARAAEQRLSDRERFLEEFQRMARENKGAEAERLQEQMRVSGWWGRGVGCMSCC